MPSHPQPDQEEQHHEENQKPSANFCVHGKEVRPKREDDDQKPLAHDDGVNDEKESPTPRVLLKSQKNPPALSGREISKESSPPDKPRIAEVCESEIPRPNNTSTSCQVPGLSEELEDI